MVEGKVEPFKGDGESNKYLHKKFKKVATLEETTPPNGKAKGTLFAIPEEESNQESEVRAGYVCPYCKLSCAKPSVLQKHIRAHTNERPYPCLPCGFAFKTKSNLYKHCRSRAHTLKIDETDYPGPGASSTSEEEEARTEPSKAPSKIYKPKFHKAALLYAEEREWSNSSSALPSPSPDILQRHIDKLIDENHALLDSPEAARPKKRHSKESPPPSPRNGESKLALALLRSREEPPESESPLNLSVRSSHEDLLQAILHGAVKNVMVERYPRPSPVVFRYEEHRSAKEELKRPRTPPAVGEPSPGPLLGGTLLVDDPSVKKRRLEGGGKGIQGVHMYGGEVRILDGGEAKTLRIEPGEESDWREVRPFKRELKISKPGLHSAGAALVHDPPARPRLPFSPPIDPLTSITAFNPLTLPPHTNPYNGGVVTILHGGKTIPYVPGMPGPNSLLSAPTLVPVEQSSVIVKTPTMEPDKMLTFSPVKVSLPPTRAESEEVPHKRSRPFDLPRIPPAKKEPPSTAEESTPTSIGPEKKFLRPSSLPLKPGTYMPKRHATMPCSVSLVSPETPRPRKSYGQLYLNGHAYTYLGLKCSTRMFFCTLNKPQPIYLPLSPEHNKVSMYSNWEICRDSNPNPLGLDPGTAMANYDSRNRSSIYTIANRNKQDVITTHSTYLSKRENKTPDGDRSESSDKFDGLLDGDVPKRIKVCDGGFESNEEYIYVRGRGRGRYVCEECGIRCKKPSMLKKHIRTHTDLRPYTCRHCAFSFKTKGNLTKHMKSKAHNKKCIELDISPVPTSIEDCSNDNYKCTQEIVPGDESDDETDEDDDDEDDEETEDEEEGKVRLAAKSLLSLSEVTPQAAHRQFVSAGLVSGRPRTYPYTLSTSQISHDVEPVLIKGVSPMPEKELRRESSLSLSESDSSDTKSADLADTRRNSVSEPQPQEPAWPMDLSNKSTGVKTGAMISGVGGQASLLATICSTTEKINTTTVQPSGVSGDMAEESQLLHAYLTERAVRDTLIKQHQCHDKKSHFAKVPDVSPTGPTEEAKLLEPKVAEVRPTVESPKPQVKEVPLSETPHAVAKESALGILALTTSDAKKSHNSMPPISPNRKLKAEFMPPSTGPSPSYVSIMEDGRSMCGICNKVFNKPSQLRLHVNIHYFERPFRCESCAVSFRTKGHLQKHQRSLSHLNKVNMNSTFGAATTSNPRPFKCDDCKIAFRIHGHLAKHLRSKMHIMKLECLGKLPFGTYAELERSGMNMNDIDTTDCENSLESLQNLAQKLYEKDPSKLGQWAPSEMMGHHHSAGSCGESSSEDEPSPPPHLHHDSESLALKTDPPDRSFITDSNFADNLTEDGVR